MNHGGQRRWRKTSHLLVAALLGVLTLALYAPVRNHSFVTYDDPIYVTENAEVQAGITPAGVHWAFTSMRTGNWHPVTWISHMLDCALWGLDPGPPHVMNALLHAANAIVLYYLLLAMTGALAPSAFVAAAFALHPLHIESAAWIAERKDLLSTLFGLLAIAAWVRWTRRGGAFTYAAAIAAYALSLASKPMLVTLPLLMLLLDVWPLHRFDPWGRSPDARPAPPSAGSTAGPPPLPVRRWPRLAEKAPFVMMACASAVIAFIAQARSGATATIEVVGIASRFQNAIVAYAAYALDALRPVNLSVLYPLRERTPAWMFESAAFFLVTVTVLVVWGGRRRPWLAVGWLWYLVLLLPVLGLVQVGVQSHADRYTYLPLEGLFIMAAWGLPEVLSLARVRRSLLVATAGAFLLCWAILSRRQLGFWSNSVTLYTHALEIDDDNPVIHYNLADSLAEAGELEQAVSHYREALASEPDFLDARNNLGNTLRRMGRLDESIAAYRAALYYDPDFALGHDNLGLALAEAGRLQEAVAHYGEALRLDPTFAAARRNLGRALFGLGRLDEAAARFHEVIDGNPRDAEARYRLGNVLAEQERFIDAVSQYEASIRIRPGSAAVHVRLAGLLAGLGRSAEASAHYCQAMHLDPGAEGLARAGALPRSRPVLDASLAPFRGKCPIGTGSRGSEPAMADGYLARLIRPR